MNRPSEAVGTSEAVSDCKRERLLLQQALPFFTPVLPLGERIPPRFAAAVRA